MFPICNNIVRKVTCVCVSVRGAQRICLWLSGGGGGGGAVRLHTLHKIYFYKTCT